MVIVVPIVIVVIMMIVPLVIMVVLFPAMSMRSRYRHPASRLFGEIGRCLMIVLSIHR